MSELEALPRATNGRNGVAVRSKEIKAAGGLSSVKLIGAPDRDVVAAATAAGRILISPDRG